VDKNLELAQSIKEKLELYLVGLAFATLALAIQTAKFDGSTISQVAELVGWFFMTISAISGLWRFNYIGPLYSQYAEIKRKEAEGVRMEQAQINGHQMWETTEGPRPIPEILAALKAGVERLEKDSDARHRWIVRGYHVHVWSLFAGIAALMFARGHDHVARLIGRLLCP
jgi:hypothetical protein